MQIDLTIALVAAGSALLGSLIPTLVNYVNARNARQFEVQKELLVVQRDTYPQLLMSLQAVMNHGDTEFKGFQDAIIRVSVFGDPVTANAASAYYYQLVSRGSELSKEDHQKHQRVILNAMRNHLGLSAVQEFELVRFSPNSSHVT